MKQTNTAVKVAKEKVEKEEVKVVRLTRSIPVEIAKPLSITWNELGDLLRDRRAVVHRLLNAGVMHLASKMHADGEEKFTALAGIKAELVGYQKWCAEQALKAGDERVRSTLERRSKMTLASCITDAISHRCWDDMSKWWKRKDTRIPSAKKGAPIYIRNTGWQLRQDNGGVSLGLKLVGATPKNLRPGSVWVALRPSTGKHHAAVACMLSGAVKCGDCKIVYEEKSKKWFAILSYSYEMVPGPPPKGDDAFIVHRGMRHFLYGLCTDGRTRQIAGHKFRVTRERFTERARQAKNIRAYERGSGAKGHGTARRFATHDQLDGKMKAVTKTFCQQAASWVTKQARDMGCGVVYIESYGGQEPSEDRGERRFLDHFPYFQLKSSIAWACKREGLTLREYSASFISQTCPMCGHLDSAQHNVRTGVFHCSAPACGFERGVDWVAAFNAAKIAKVVGIEKIEKSLEQQKKFKRSLENQKKDRDNGIANAVVSAGQGVRVPSSRSRRGQPIK